MNAGYRAPDRDPRPLWTTAAASARSDRLLGDRPRVLPLLARQQSPQIPDRVPTRLGTGKSRPDQRRDLIPACRPLPHIRHSNIAPHRQGLTRPQPAAPKTAIAEALATP